MGDFVKKVAEACLQRSVRKLSALIDEAVPPIIAATKPRATGLEMLPSSFIVANLLNPAAIADGPHLPPDAELALLTANGKHFGAVQGLEVEAFEP